jgi:putative flippase GtrA
VLSWLVEQLLEQIERRRNFITYAVIGVSGATLDFVLFEIFLWAGLSMQIANFISVSAGITNNFFLNARLNFRVSDRLLRRFVAFYAVGMVGLVLSAAILELGVGWLGVSARIAKASSIVIVVVTQYSLNKVLAFRGGT